MRSNSIYLDTETVGFHGFATLIQWAKEDGPIHLYNPWDEPVAKTLELIEMVMEHTLVGFNLVFDHFHLCKMYTTWKLLPSDAVPIEIVEKVAFAEKEARDGPCLKPAGAVDLMLHSRKGEFQKLMSRHDVRIRKVPTTLASELASELEQRVELDGILFANRKNPDAPRWVIADRKLRGKDDKIDPEFKDVVLKFRPSGGLKFLAQFCLGLDPEFHSFKEVLPPREEKLAELGYAPFALAISNAPDWKAPKGYTWPHFIEAEAAWWRDNKEARRYANDDVVYTRLLDDYFGFPEANDDDSILACAVAAVRWHGFRLDLDKLRALKAKSGKVVETSPVNVNSPKEVKAYIREVMDETEAAIIDKSTDKAHLEKIRSTLIVEDEPEMCIACMGSGCLRCEGVGELPLGPTLASRRADEILKIKVAVKEIELYRKLLLAGRFHADFKVIGTLSSRMAGGGGLNAQGIKNSTEVRDAFPMAWPGTPLCGGDFDGFEVTLADAVFQDEGLRADLRAGKSMHLAMASCLYPDKTEEEIKASKGHADGGDIDMYTRGKQAVFATLYGGDANTINKKLSIPKKVAEAAFDSFQQRYPGIKNARDKIAEDFAALSQEGGIGTKIKYRRRLNISPRRILWKHS